jgi:pyruvate/2-oxoglutarate dehydrogenase complex dihydrolipoamide dehydrogenase (E3) component
MSNHFDSIIIGAGQAGPSLAGRLTQAGQKIAFIERKSFGGTCVNTGCIPTKTMVASAYAAHMARRAGDFGVMIPGSIQVDMKAVKARKEAILGKSRDGIERWLRGMTNCTVFHESARFVSGHEIVAGAETISADQIFINVGGRAIVP